ncbi:hypothetical protein EJ05DRAFT_36343 [Pseudovirgaria hyperparasitica]|uniref:Uncharacterized protein n=1 Tax=Pseudovirgaria hyperparasitica TaxID=470096 RepID=A0A6A6WMI1_9PEZI|nr:uncharacterized protein EJ05DRAFT_36343 [Pseudovirgaria hyperparasitica]KAF2763362.1 hypothetical protein EJ05DRAFT_36343 [Pseudovirgaria hyperparasitica]
MGCGDDGSFCGRRIAPSSVILISCMRVLKLQLETRTARGRRGWRHGVKHQCSGACVRVATGSHRRRRLVLPWLALCPAPSSSPFFVSFQCVPGLTNLPHVPLSPLRDESQRSMEYTGSPVLLPAFPIP